MRELIIAGHVAWIRQINAYSVLVGKPLGKCPPRKKYVDDINALTPGLSLKIFNADYWIKTSKNEAWHLGAYQEEILQNSF